MSNIEKKQYKVFARKYRPETFENLVGQEFLVKTLTNANFNTRTFLLIKFSNFILSL